MFMNKEKAIVILGGGIKKIKDKWRTTSFQEGDEFGALGDRLRVIAGSYLYNDDRELTIIALGGKGQLKKFPDAPPVSSVIKEELIERGIPENVIIEEDKSGSTYEQLQELKSIIHDKNFESVIIISNEYHLPRIQAIIKQDVELKKMLNTLQIEVKSAEKSLIEHEPGWEKVIKSIYGGEAMQERIALEQKGVRDIKEGKYKLR